jgi:hypothetical protein
LNPGALVSLALAVGVAAFVLAPLLRTGAAEDETRTSAGSELQDLRSRHDMALGALRDLEDDRATGKIDERDYEELKGRLTAQAVEILKELDAHERTHPSIAKRRRADKR